MIAEPHLAVDWNGELPNVGQDAAVFLIHLKQGQPYLARTTMLKRRLARLLAPRPGARLLDLSKIAERIEVWLTPTRLEQALTFYSLAKAHFPETYRKIVRLPSPPYLKVLLTNEFPRTMVTSRLSGRENLFFGPFRNRAEAEKWEGETLDFFQLRRCEEDLEPNPDHPGCIYGEMNQCLRPCQAWVGVNEYATEVKRLTGFIESHGVTLREAVAHARDRASENLEFEEAARQHKRLERVEGLLRMASEITGDIRKANGVSAVKAGMSVRLYFMLDGIWQAPVEFDMKMQAGESMDRRLRQIVEGFAVSRPTLKEREEHLAMLARWFYSSWRDSEWLPFADRAELPYRKLVRLISRVMNPAPAHANMSGNDVKDSA
jgi:excinuclease ABC subunit C